MNRAGLNIKLTNHLRQRHFLKCALVVILFLSSLQLQAQVISNNEASISINSGIVVVSKDFTNTAARLNNFGTLNLLGNFTNNTLSNTAGNGVFRVGGNWTSLGNFIHGTSTVIFNGSGNQQISNPSQTFYSLSVDNTGASSGFSVRLGNTVKITGVLSMQTGNITTNNDSYILHLDNPAVSSLNYTSTTESRIFGKFERGIGQTGSYLFPLGNISRPLYYNPATLTVNTLTTTGSVLSEFITSPPGNAGLPLADITIVPEEEVNSAFTTGYWNMTSNGGLSISNYNVELYAAGFDNVTDTVRENSRVIKRITAGGNWTLDGTHVNASGSLVKRINLTDNISNLGTQYAIGAVNPLITSHPASITVCENSNPSFSVTASGSAPLTYIWYKDGSPILSGPHYTGNRSATLVINGADLSDAGTYYCVVRDRFFNTTTSGSATLVVNKIPVATAFPLAQNHECSEVPFGNIALGLSYYDVGTRFAWSRTTDSNIITAIPMSGTEYNIGDVLSGAFENTSNAPITITFQITPIGPGTTECTGQPIYSSVTVNPKPRIIPFISEICYGGSAVISLVSDTELTMPKEDVLEFGYKTYRTDLSVSGFMGSQSNVAYGTVISSSYFNSSDTLQSIIYNIVPTFSSALGCLSGDTVSFEAKIHAQPLQNLIITKPLTCDGGSDASIQAITSRGAGGLDGYYFDWIRTSSDQRHGYKLDSLTNGSGGIWTVTVTDSLGCKNERSISVSGAKFDPYMYVPVDPLSGYATSCVSSTDGQIWVMETGYLTGTAPFEYWIVKAGQDTASMSNHGYITNRGVFTILTGFDAGIYTLYMRDINGCYNTETQQVELTAPPEILVTFESKKYTGNFDISCKGYSDGEVWLKTISGGNGGYRYKWTTVNGTITGVDTLDRIENITAGKYYIHITDIKGCTKIDSIVIVEPPGMTLDSYELSTKNGSNVSCYGGEDGYINIQISGGTGVYTYQWTGQDGFTSNQRNIAQLKAGVYGSLVRDANGCLLVPAPSFTLIEPPEISVSTTPSVSADGGYNIDYNGGTGSVQVTVTGGASGTYQYIWNTANGSGIVAGQKDQSSLTAGDYFLTVRDINGCEKTERIILTQPNALNLQFITKHITCASSIFNDGAIFLTVSGGVAPYTYVWSNGATTKDISGLTEGEYFVTVTDINGSTVTGSAETINPPPLIYTPQVSDYNGFGVSCFGMSNGYIHIDITSGTPPYLFSWTGPDGFSASTRNISGLKAGTYTMQITDNLGCVTNQIFNLSEPDKFEMTLNVSMSLDGRYNISCAGGKTGYIQVESVNGIGKVEYLWSDGLYGQIRNNLLAGNYNIIITDSNGCYANTSVTLTEPDPLKINFNVIEPLCSDMTAGVITTEVEGGVVTGSYNYRWMNNSTSSSLTNVGTGWYSVAIEDLNGCIVTDSVKVEAQSGSCLLIPNAISPNGDMINDVWNIGNIHLYPNVEVKIFNRWGYSVWTSEKGYPRPWDGTHAGRDLPVDSYHYIIDLNNGGKPIIGTITIVK